jgi:SAM-dependent methyltransferase
MLRSTHGHYSRHYSARARELVARAYAEDLETFGYHFEEAPGPLRTSTPGVARDARERQSEPEGEGSDDRGARTPSLLCIGSGAFDRPGWRNLDLPSRQYEARQSARIDYAHDLMSLEPLPLADGDLDAAYCSHVIEHLSDEAALHLFRETHRALRGGGVFRVSCPDIAHIHRAFAREDRFFFSRFAFAQLLPDLSLPQAFLHCFAYPRTTHAKKRLCEPLGDAAVYELFGRLPLEEALAEVARPIPVAEANRLFPQAHHNWWTVPKLERFLREAGFRTVIEQRFNCTASPHMIDRSTFDATRPFMSLYVEAIR